MMQRATKKIREVDPLQNDRIQTGISPAIRPPTLNLALTVAAGRASFGMFVRQCRKRLGMTLAEVALKIGCQKGYLSMIETGQRPPPTDYLVMQLENVLGFTSGELAEAAHWETAPAIVRQRFLQKEEAQAELTRQFNVRSTQPESRPSPFGNLRNLDALLADGSLRQFVEQTGGNTAGVQPLTQSVPIINCVAAGYPTEFTDLDYPARVADDYLACPAEMIESDDFAARVVGESMEPEYHEGDTIVFSPNAPTPSGSDCFIRLEPDHQSTFKRIFFEGADDCRIRLQPLNSAFRERVVDREEVAGMYAAIYVMRRIRTAARAGR